VVGISKYERHVVEKALVALQSNEFVASIAKLHFKLSLGSRIWYRAQPTANWPTLFAA
jgi:hypothetical protein